MTYSINEAKYRDERFEIIGTEDISHLSNLVSQSDDKEQTIYRLRRVVAGTRKKPYTVSCFRFKESGQFITAF